MFDTRKVPEKTEKSSLLDSLSKVTSLKKQTELMDILLAFHPTHAERLWLVGFLKFVGYTEVEVVDLIHNHHDWDDYDEEETAYQVASVFGSVHRRGSSQTANRPKRVRKWDLTEEEIRKIKIARSSQVDRNITRILKGHGVRLYESRHPYRPELLNFDKRAPLFINVGVQ